MDPNIERASRGDRDAMAAIVAEHYPAVYRFCARRIGCELAQDAAQESFLQAQKAIRRFDGRSSLSTWLFGIAHNVCRNLARKQRVDMTYEAAFLESQPGASPEGSLIDREALRKALSKLSPEHREAVVLHELEDMTYEEAAQVIGVPVGTVKSRLFHAFSQLRRLLAEETDR
jgi:RNA polymerase sigma-70 factor (ECF subfamily)